jgi:chemotaxis protein MotB
MERLNLLARLALVASMPIIGVGCVAQDKYDKLVSTNRSLEEQIVMLEDERDAARANLETLRAQLSHASDDLAGLRGRNQGLSGEVDAMNAQYDDMMKRLADLQFGPLPDDISEALVQLAKEHPDVLTFDPQRGMLRFASDFTFALGSTDISGDAVSTLSQLAQILNSPNASGLEIRVIGHTDNVPINRVRAQHPTNMHLSAHRAIAVRDALVKSGVSPERFQVAGYGEFRPVVANGAKGAAQNRRVEIFLLPMPGVFASAPQSAPPGVPDEPMK